MHVSDWSADVCSTDRNIERGMRLTQGGTGKAIAISRPTLFLAQDREMAEEAWPGDIIGIPNHGTLRVGDTLSERTDVTITGLPNFAPEILRRVALVDPTKTKQLRKALDDMAEEGIVQVFYPEIRSEEHTSELQSLMRISYAVFSLKKKQRSTE